MTRTSFAASVEFRKVVIHLFLKEEKICYKMVYYTLYFCWANREKSRL